MGLNRKSLERIQMALALQKELTTRLESDNNESYKVVLDELNVCLNAVQQLKSERHLEVLLPQAIKKAKKILG